MGWGAEKGRGPRRHQQCSVMPSLFSVSFLSLWDRNLRGQGQGSIALHGWGLAPCSSLLAHLSECKPSVPPGPQLLLPWPGAISRRT